MKIIRIKNVIRFFQNKNNLYGSHPYYTVIENDGNTHGVLLYNSNAMGENRLHVNKF